MRFAGVILSFILCSIAVANGEDSNADQPCSFSIQNYWQQVGGSVWDLIEIDHPQISRWRSEITRTFKIWSSEQRRFSHGYSSSATTQGHTFTIFIPTKSDEPRRMILRIESQPYPTIWGENGETERINQPFVEFQELFTKSLVETLIVEERPLKPGLRVSNLASKSGSKFTLRATVDVPVDSHHLHLLMMLTERLRRTQLVH